MRIITSHRLVYIELSLVEVINMYRPFFIVTPTSTEYLYNFYRFIIQSLPLNNPAAWLDLINNTNLT